MARRTDTELIDDPKWREIVIRLIKAEKAKSGMSYDNISSTLKTEFGIEQTSGNLKSKFSRGNFGAQLLLQLFCVMGTTNIGVDAVLDIYKKVD